MLVNVLIVFFLLLILYQIFLAYFNCVEGLDNYQNYDLNNPNNALILAQQNAGNIEFLKNIPKYTRFEGATILEIKKYLLETGIPCRID